MLKRNTLSSFNKEKVKSLATSIIQEFFDPNYNSNITLGGTIDISILANTLLSITGVTGLLTRRTSPELIREVPYLNMVVWNPNYPTTDVQFISQSLVLQNYEFPFLQQQSLLSAKIIVEDE